MLPLRRFGRFGAQKTLCSRPHCFSLDGTTQIFSGRFFKDILACTTFVAPNLHACHFWMAKHFPLTQGSCIIIIFCEGFRVLTAACLLRESKGGRWQNGLAAKARCFLEIVVSRSSELCSFCTFYMFELRWKVACLQFCFRVLTAACLLRESKGSRWLWLPRRGVLMR